MNKAPVTAIINSKRILADKNSLIFKKIDPVRQIDSEITYTHYDVSIKIHNRRLIEKTSRKIEKLPRGNLFYFILFIFYYFIFLEVLRNEEYVKKIKGIINVEEADTKQIENDSISEKI